MSRREFVWRGAGLVSSTYLVASVGSAALLAPARARAGDDNTFHPWFSQPLSGSLSGLKLASCSALRADLAGIEASLQELSAAPDAVGKRLYEHYRSERDALDRAMSVNLSNLQVDQVDDGFAKLNLALTIGFTAGALFFAVNPIALGTLAAVQIIGQTSILGWQLYSRGGHGGGVDVIVGYARDRTLLTASLASQGAKFGSRVLTPLSLLVSARDAWKADGDLDQTKQRLQSVKSRLGDLRGLYEALGAAPAKWAEEKRQALRAAKTGLGQFIEAHQATDCRVTGPAIGSLP